MITGIKNLKKRGKGKSTIAFDFTTLYTKIPHWKLLKVLNELNDFCFDEEYNKYISVNEFGARWISKPDSYFVIFDRFSFKKAIKSVSVFFFLFFFFFVVASTGNWYTNPNKIRTNSFYAKSFSFLLWGLNKSKIQSGKTWFRLGNLVICFKS